jgi:hypothetical protein
MFKGTAYEDLMSYRSTKTAVRKMVSTVPAVEKNK